MAVQILEAAELHGIVDAVSVHLILHVKNDVHPLDTVFIASVDATNLDAVDHLTCPLQDLRGLIARTVDPVLEAYLRGVLKARAQLLEQKTELGHPTRWFIE